MQSSVQVAVQLKQQTRMESQPRARPGADLALRQAAWDRFFQNVLATIHEPNPDLRRDLALDRTIRALGQRPRAPLTLTQREALLLRYEVETVLEEAETPHYDESNELILLERMACEETFEALCEAACGQTLAFPADGALI